MRRRFWIFVAVATLATTGVRAHAATFQNLDFEGYLGGFTMPPWQLVYQLGNGTVLYQNEQPGVVYPFLGFHIGDGPVIGVNGAIPQFPNQLQGKYSITLGAYPSYDGGLATESAALADKADVRLGGLAQTADVPAWAHSVWIATSMQFLSPSSVDMSFSGHRVGLGLATDSQVAQMLTQAALDPPPGLANPLVLPLGASSSHFFAGNIETIAGRTRELKVVQAPDIGVIGSPSNPFGYYVSTQTISFDMIVFSPLSWDGRAVDVPEPQSILVLLTAIPVMWLRRRAIA